MVADGGKVMPGAEADALGEAGQEATRKGPFRRVRALFG